MRFLAHLTLLHLAFVQFMPGVLGQHGGVSSDVTPGTNSSIPASVTAGLRLNFSDTVAVHTAARSGDFSTPPVTLLLILAALLVVLVLTGLVLRRNRRAQLRAQAMNYPETWRHPDTPRQRMGVLTLDPSMLEFLSLRRTPSRPAVGTSKYPILSRNATHISMLSILTSATSPSLCSICLDPVRAPGSIVRTLPCGHSFHAACVDEWLLKWQGVCPVCRMDLAQAMQGKLEGGDDVSEYEYESQDVDSSTWPSTRQSETSGLLSRPAASILARARMAMLTTQRVSWHTSASASLPRGGSGSIFDHDSNRDSVRLDVAENTEPLQNLLREVTTEPEQEVTDHRNANNGDNIVVTTMVRTRGNDVESVAPISEGHQ
ncbi:hypothetical protein M427DRAFT_58338 [Gonapodya prolifera JEL478]|uniref:RING-type domain-containing protein n=1 Tax=Gonapodya prolifera (strain JEL478) TaxID=1344416 RepID=A0A139AA56_GONPJ|nr:hypothetical protein M427DRAFT_58338 [Gonapodya prolifera JEL478]|eukprot:KXS13742.1 hypothetical protein M427DRAFT_58338 [Gonapodya prolifera JEL478]